jgi:hypothetical protein
VLGQKKVAKRIKINQGVWEGSEDADGGKNGMKL